MYAYVKRLTMRFFRVKKIDNPKFREKEEALRKSFTDQVKNEEARFRQWEQQVCRK